MKKIKKNFLVTFCLLLGMSNALADELTVSDITIPQGGNATLSVSLANSGTYRQLFQFDLTLPEGVSLVEGSAMLSEERFENTTGLSYSKLSDGVYKFVCSPSGANKTPISGDSGVLMTVNLQSDASLTVEAVLEGKITNIEMTTSESTAWNPADLSFKITVGEPLSYDVLLDENSTTAPSAATGVDVLVKRTIKANSWSTICLPFAMSEAQVKAAFGDDVKLADFKGYEVTEDGENIVGITVNFEAATAIEANHPYIINVSEPVSQFIVEGVDIAPNDKPMVNYGTKRLPKSIEGTYVAETVVPEFCLFLNDNKFWYSTSQTKMKAFRAYFNFIDVLTEVDDADLNVKMSIGGEETRIDGLMPETSNDAIYDLTGRKVEKAEKGIYIVNGKKVLVK
ncbi:MAG: hypothetical protein IKP44_05385 [Bacteroidaceae bacterium]|nr:hypothetical protein [Bacteroidaceae bacterium]